MTTFTNAHDASLALKRMMDSLGTQQLPGSITRAYAMARNALRQNLALPRVAEQRQAARETLNHLRESVRAIASASFEQSLALGEEHARLDALLLGVTLAALSARQEKIKQAAQQIDSETKRQTDALWLLIVLGALANWQMIFGNTFLNPSPVQRSAKFWITTLETQTHNALLTTALEESGLRVQRRAVLGANVNHTETCLLVNGQTVGLRENFRLVGVPRYADAMYLPPFHDFCHTTVAFERVSG